MKVYVAGPMYTGMDHVKVLMKALRKAGHKITYDWTAQPISEDGDPDERRELAEAEQNGVLQADALVLIDHDRPRGALIETGMALGDGKPVIVCLAKDKNPSLFYSLPNCTVLVEATPEDVLAALESDEP